MTAINMRPDDVASEGNAMSFALRKMIGDYAFIDIVQVMAVTGDTLTVKSLLHPVTANNEKIDGVSVFQIPYLRLQRGESAVIMDPVAGDIGLMAVCDKDTSNVRATKAESAPASRRQHSSADGVYLTGIASLNGDPSQYVKFSNSGIEVVSPVTVTVSAPTIELNGENQVSINTPAIVLNGAIQQGDGSYGGNATFGGSITAEGEVQGSGINLSTHVHGGVESGGSTTQGPQ